MARQAQIMIMQLFMLRTGLASATKKESGLEVVLMDFW